MPDFDVQQVVEAAARAAYEDAMTKKGTPFEPWETLPEYWRRIFRSQACAALAVIVPAVTEQIRALHHEEGYYFSIPGETVQICELCDTDWPCPTVRLLDELDAAVRGEQP